MEMVATTLYGLALTQGECSILTYDGSKLYKCLTQDPILNKLPWIISHVMAGRLARIILFIITTSSFVATTKITYAGASY